jgi:hypothetical protein
MHQTITKKNKQHMEAKNNKRREVKTKKNGQTRVVGESAIRRALRFRVM